MAPFPEEVDVFTEPHSRMKRLVEVYSEKIGSTDFLNDEALESFLHSLQQTFHEFKTHEQIENKLIMKKLKNKLKALSIHDAAVCNCHNDTRLVDMLALVDDGYSCTRKSYIDRQNYALKLRSALNDFTLDFIPHMQEEEEIFQPLLIKYFEYEELKLLKEKVLAEHTRWQQGNLSAEASAEKDASEVDAHSDKKEDERKHLQSSIHSLPPELLSKIFSFLSPLDLIHSSGVCKDWNELAYDPHLWKHLDPCQWAKGSWNWQTSDPSTHSPPAPCPCSESPSSPFLDEDADLDDLSNGQSEFEGKDCGAKCQQQGKAREKKVMQGVSNSLLPRVGTGILTLRFSQSSALTSRLLLSILKQCPNLRYLDVSYTGVTDYAFKCVQEHKACRQLEHLDLSGCEDITDLGLERLSSCFGLQTSNRTVCNRSLKEPWRVTPWDCSSVFECPYSRLPCPYANQKLNIFACHGRVQPKLKFLSLSGCYQITDAGLRVLSRLGLLSCVEHLDVSGCWQLSGLCLQEVVYSAPRLSPEGLFYCNYIQDGPYQDLANGCENLECTSRACCCQGD